MSLLRDESASDSDWSDAALFKVLAAQRPQIAPPLQAFPFSFRYQLALPLVQPIAILV